ncbi:Prp18-domain-containing protein [Coemansia reversa NRRL 1564]|uniref:Pre-mRNA-splicing factor 18 n=1 Tax=Coemansia reversa (strain ATCC 12441 / NRRL 1564) TaxID=763665 RepID=A0A2G5BDM4_COERN|nr:Prp18-domain-containing protein [Coemansia reversa NRRL 1564]|eukprot:PIA17105.1 Prp18-domain-containing protein [Coemansia reversa NRRL 1564]
MTMAIPNHGDDIDSQALSSISSEEVVKRLRARSEPIRLFGESDEQRRRRLRHLELSEEKTDGQQNEFRRMMAQVEAGAMLESLKRQANMDDDEEEKRREKFAMLMEYDVSDISLELLRTDMDRLHTLLYVYFKRLLYEWGDYLASRPEDERRSAEGKMAAATQRQSAEYLKPLFRSLKQRKLQADVMARITEIARSTLDREYMNANDAYLQLSVGNAPWPIGITQVGIHSRAARENISASKVAHVLNDETQRKWIQSIKRLVRFAQTKYPPADLSKLSG